MKNLIYFIIILLLSISTGCNNKDEFALDTNEAFIEDEIKEDEQLDVNKEDTKSALIYVYICGQVVDEGMYEFISGDRIFHAIEAAGGFTDKADKTSVNQALLLEDEMQIYIPAIGEEVLSSTESADDGKININMATKEQLMTLPGIGESKANAIISYRESKGSFNSIEDIMNIEGIKAGVFSNIENFIKVN